MVNANNADCIAFDTHTCIARGSLIEVAEVVKNYMGEDIFKPVQILSIPASEPVEIDFRGSLDEVMARLKRRSVSRPEPAEGEARKPPKKAGRPKLGVVSKEVTLLPRHWEWLKKQPGGASVTLRKLVEEARKAHSLQDDLRYSQEVTYRFLTCVAGNLPHYEEVTRALFAGNEDGFKEHTSHWPVDVRAHAEELSRAAFLKDLSC